MIGASSAVIWVTPRPGRDHTRQNSERPYTSRPALDHPKVGSNRDELQFAPMKKVVFRYVLLLSGLSLTLLPAGAQTLLVVNQGDSNTSIVDLVAGREVATVADNTPGVHGHEVAASADGRMAFVPIYGSSGVGKPGIDGREMLVIDIASREDCWAYRFRTWHSAPLSSSRSTERAALCHD